MSMLQEFKAFAMRGNVMDMAVGIVIGAAFGKIVTSLVDDVIMPPIGWITGGVDFSKLRWVLKPADNTDPANRIAEVAISYGAFINTLITFIIIALAIFMVIKLMNRMQRKQAEAPAAPPADVALLTEIRDLLKTRQ
ncbi:MAG: large-conductance mechanosensitive channel protein MscL [Rhodanobacter sp.]